MIGVGAAVSSVLGCSRILSHLLFVDDLASKLAPLPAPLPHPPHGARRARANRVEQLVLGVERQLLRAAVAAGAKGWLPQDRGTVHGHRWAARLRLRRGWVRWGAWPRRRFRRQPIGAWSKSQRNIAHAGLSLGAAGFL